MKKASIILISAITVSMMLMAVAPALAARTPKAGQILVKVLDASGRGYAKAGVIVYQPTYSTVDARTVVKSTKGNGVVVFNLDRGDTFLGSFEEGQVEVAVYKKGVGYFVFPGYALDAGPSGSIVIQTDW